MPNRKRGGNEPPLNISHLIFSNIVHKVVFLGIHQFRQFRLGIGTFSFFHTIRQEMYNGWRHFINAKHFQYTCMQDTV